MNVVDDNFLYLNADNVWPGFQWEGLELREGGALQLFSLPLLEDILPERIASLPAPDGPAGVAVDDFGAIYFSDPNANRVLRIIPIATGAAIPITFTTQDEESIQLNTPRGLLLQRQHSLIVVDSGAHRLLVFDPSSLRLLETWGRTGAAGPDPGLFDTPTAISGDGDGDVYVLDEGNRRVQKFRANGSVISEFWETMQGVGLLSRPADIAVNEVDGATRVYVLDTTERRVFVFDGEGNAVRDHRDQLVVVSLESSQQPMGMVAAGQALYLGDNGDRRVITYKWKEGSLVFAGQAIGYSGPVAGLASDGRGNLLVHTGATQPEIPDDALAPVRLALDKGYRGAGILWSDAVRAGDAQSGWRRLRAQAGSLASTSHLRFSFHTSNNETQPPTVDPVNGQFFPSPWQSLPIDVTEMYIGGEPSRFLRIGAQFLGDGLSTPSLTQMRVDFDQRSYLRYLPPVYREEPESGEFLSRFLGLFESFFSEIEAKIANLSALFDPLAAPREFFPWLAGWLALPLRQELVRRKDESDADYETRKALLNLEFFKTAVQLYPQRGTLPAIDAMLRAWLRGELLENDPPLLHLTDMQPLHSDAASFFQLAPEDDEDRVAGETYARVGVATFLGAGPPFFFIADLTLDQKIRELHHPAGIEIFERAARQLLDGEKPAHTFYQLRLSAEALSMRLAPENYADWRPGEIYAQIGETTLLWDE